jgi:hypothetical protein
MYRKGKEIRKKRQLAAFVFVPSVFGENFPIAEFLMISAETSCSEIEKNSQMFNEDFHLQLYLPLWLTTFGCTLFRTRMTDS